MFNKLNSLRRHNKGFSLVELIIVMAIMVALIAVLAPQFIKYVQRSRDATVETAAEDVIQDLKAAYVSGYLTGDSEFTVYGGSAGDEQGFVNIAVVTDPTYANTDEIADQAALLTELGFDADGHGKNNASAKSWTITATFDAASNAVDISKTAA